MTDLSSASFGDPDELAFARRRDPRRLAFVGAGAAVVIGLLALVASVAGSSEPEAKAVQRDTKSTTAAAVAPPHVVTALPAAPPVTEVPATTKTPPPPSTGAAPRPSSAPKVAAKPSSKAAPARKASSGGPKLIKVQSGGVPNDRAH